MFSCRRVLLRVLVRMSETDWFTIDTSISTKAVAETSTPSVGALSLHLWQWLNPKP